MSDKLSTLSQVEGGEKVSRSGDAAGSTTMPNVQARRARWLTALACRVRAWAPPMVVVVLAVVLWQWYALNNPYVIPTLGTMWTSLSEQPGLYWPNLTTTVQEVAMGGAIGISLAFLVAILMAEVKVIERALMPAAVILMVVPHVALAPALVIAFGFGLAPKLIIISLVVFFPVLINTLAGLKSVDPAALDVFTTLHASRWEIFWRLRLPGSLPHVFTGFQVAFPLAVVGATVAEFAAAGLTSGLGSLIVLASSQSDLAVVWNAILMLCVLGIAISGLATFCRKRFVRWDSQADVSGR